MEEKKEEKLSYEQLENVATQLRDRAVALEQQLKGINSALYRLGFLLKILEIKDVFPQDFVQKCAEEVVSLVTIEEPCEYPHEEDKGNGISE